MSIQTFVYRSTMPASAEEVFHWHANPSAFERYNPPWDPVEVVEQSGTIEPGATKVIRMRMGPFRRTWVAEHGEWQPPVFFTDEQTKGPFKRFKHTHKMEPAGADQCLLEDRIEYELPLGRIGQVLGGGMARRQLLKTFTYRHDTLRLDMAILTRYKEKPTMKVLISGATGLVGTELTTLLQAGGHETAALTRSKQNESDIYWDPAKGDLEADKIDGFDAVVHLAGENIAQGRWTEEKKQRIRDSRVQGTQMLSEALAKLENPPRVLVSASAIGYYGDRDNEVLNEESAPGDLFISDVCKEWEGAAKPAADAGIRVVHPRIGIVLTPKGGALKKMLTPFKMGMAGKFGSGKQYMSWITLDDVAGVIFHLLHNDDIHGPVNCVSPNPVTNYEFTKTLGRVLVRPTIFPMPGFAAKMLFGQMANELLLSSARVIPERLVHSDYEFRHPELEEALRYLLGKQVKESESVPA